MYRINGKNREGVPLIPITDEDYLRPEDIHENWVFIPTEIGLNEMIDRGMFMLDEYLVALDSLQLIALYNRGAFGVTYEMPLEDLNLTEFFVIDLNRVVGTLEAVSGKGIYIRTNERYERFAFNRDNSSITAFMKYMQKPGGGGISKIIGWIVRFRKRKEVENV